jgi:hypothetical protein
VLLLKWIAVRGAFSVDADDAFLLVGASVTTPGGKPYARAQGGLIVPQFLARIRAAAGKAPR